MIDLSWISALAPWLLTRDTALLLVDGFVVGIFSVIIGGGFFISIPLLQFLFPSVSYGAILGNLKVGLLPRHWLHDHRNLILAL